MIFCCVAIVAELEVVPEWIQPHHAVDHFSLLLPPVQRLILQGDTIRSGGSVYGSGGTPGGMGGGAGGSVHPPTPQDTAVPTSLVLDLQRG